MDERSDEHLAALSRGGDPGAFNALAARWEPDIYRFLRRRVRDREEAADLCQETFVRAFLAIDRLRDGSRFRTWLYQIALNLARSRARTSRAKAEVRTFLEDGLDEARLAVEHPGFEAPDRQASRSRLQDSLREALEVLPEPQRNAILLREFHGLTTEEIAEISGVPAGTVRSRIFYGLKAVRRALEARGWTADEVAP